MGLKGFADWGDKIAKVVLREVMPDDFIKALTKAGVDPGDIINGLV
jgi:hypothetical protein